MLRRELKQLFRLALPLAAAQAGTQMMTIVDVAVLGRYSSRDLAAVGYANAFFFAIAIVGMGAVFGIDPLVSQAVGAGDPVRARRVLWQGVWFALIVTAVLSFGIVGGAALMSHVGVDPGIILPGQQYLLIRGIGLAPLLLFLVVRAYLQAKSITRPLIVAMIVANIVNFFGDLLLVFGWGPIPALGAAGAAISTVAATLLELAIVVYAVSKIPVDAEDLRRWNGAEIARMVRVGWPVAMQLGAEIGIFALVGVLAARLGTAALAAHQVVISVASFTYTMALGVAGAGSVRVGIAVGSRDVASTRNAGRAAFLGGLTVMTISGIAFASFPGPLARLLTSDGPVIAIAIPLFIVAAFFQLSDGLQAVGSGILRGAGDTHFSFIANLIGHWLIGAPIAFWLGFHQRMGIVGLWWGLCVGLTVVAIMLVYRFERISASPIVPVIER